MPQSDDERDNEGNGNNNIGWGVAGAIGLVGIGAWLAFGRENAPNVENEDNIQPPIGLGTNENHREQQLTEIVKVQIRTLLELNYEPQLVAEEYEAPAAHLGRGDLVFKELYQNSYHVVEVKWLDHVREGRNAREAKRQKKREVEEQAQKYGQFWKSGHPRAQVTAYAVINDETTGGPIVWETYSIQ